MELAIRVTGRRNILPQCICWRTEKTAGTSTWKKNSENESRDGFKVKQPSWFYHTSYHGAIQTRESKSTVNAYGVENGEEPNSLIALLAGNGNESRNITGAIARSTRAGCHQVFHEKQHAYSLKSQNTLIYNIRSLLIIMKHHIGMTQHHIHCFVSASRCSILSRSIFNWAKRTKRPIQLRRMPFHTFSNYFQVQIPFPTTHQRHS